MYGDCEIVWKGRVCDCIFINLRVFVEILLSFLKKNIHSLLLMCEKAKVELSTTVQQRNSNRKKSGNRTKCVERRHTQNKNGREEKNKKKIKINVGSSQTIETPPTTTVDD